LPKADLEGVSPTKLVKSLDPSKLRQLHLVKKRKKENTTPSKYQRGGKIRAKKKEKKKKYFQKLSLLSNKYIKQWYFHDTF